MNILIGFNLIMVVVWFLLSMWYCSKIDNYEHFYSNWRILSMLTVLGSSGIYFIFK